MITLTDEHNGKRISIEMDVDTADMILPDLEELFTSFVNAIGIRGFIVEINPENIDDGFTFTPEQPEESK